MNMKAMTANELKTRGVSAVEELLETEDEVIITVRGREKHVVLSLEKYSQLREYELDIAVQEAREDYAAGRVTTESVGEHANRVTGEVY